MKKYVLNFPLAKQHPLFLQFLKRFQSAIQRNAFCNGKEHTPISVINASKYIISTDEQAVFVLTPKIFFEELMRELHVLVKEKMNAGLTPEQLLELFFNSDGFKSLFDDMTVYSWSKSFPDFYQHMVDESFFYFTDNKNDYYFNLFRFIKKEQFVGGILHSLASHYEDFNMLHKSADGSRYQYNLFMYNLINCSLNGAVVSTRPAKTTGDYLLHKELKIEDRFLNVVLYWDDLRKVFIITTAYESSNSKLKI